MLQSLSNVGRYLSPDAHFSVQQLQFRRSADVTQVFLALPFYSRGNSKQHGAILNFWILNPTPHNGKICLKKYEFQENLCVYVLKTVWLMIGPPFFSTKSRGRSGYPAKCGEAQPARRSLKRTNTDPKWQIVTTVTNKQSDDVPAISPIVCQCEGY